MIQVPAPSVAQPGAARVPPTTPAATSGTPTGGTTARALTAGGTGPPDGAAAAGSAPAASAAAAAAAAEVRTRPVACRTRSRYAARRQLRREGRQSAGAGIEAVVAAHPFGSSPSVVVVGPGAADIGQQRAHPLDVIGHDRAHAALEEPVEVDPGQVVAEHARPAGHRVEEAVGRRSRPRACRPSGR